MGLWKGRGSKLEELMGICCKRYSSSLVVDWGSGDGGGGLMRCEKADATLLSIWSRWVRSAVLTPLGCLSL